MPRRKRRHRSVEEVETLLGRARARGLSQRQLAEELGVHPNTVGNWLRRERSHRPSRAQPGSERSVCSLVPVRVAEPIASAEESCSGDGESRLELVVERALGDRNVTLRLSHGFDPNDLRSVLEAIAEHTC